MNVGFTGTQRGMSGDQAAAVARLLFHLLKKDESGEPEFWHGDCVGADEQAEELARLCGYSTRAWPGPESSKQANTPSTYRMSPATGFLLRNRVIASGCDPLIAAPASEEIVRSGTWSTVRYARTNKKTVFIVEANGRIDQEVPVAKPGSVVPRHTVYGVILR